MPRTVRLASDLAIRAVVTARARLLARRVWGPELAPAEQLEWEARTGRLAARAAFLAAGLIAASAAIQTAALGTRPVAISTRTDDPAAALARFDQHGAEMALRQLLIVSSYVLLAVALWYLMRVALRREPPHRARFFARFYGWCVIVGPLMIAVGVIWGYVELSQIADELVASGDPSNSLAESLLEDRSSTPGLIHLLGWVSVVIAVFTFTFLANVVGLIDMLTWLVSVAVSMSMIYQDLAPAFVATLEIAWLVGLGALFLDRWPGGRGEAWKTVPSRPPPAR